MLEEIKKYLKNEEDFNVVMDIIEEYATESYNYGYEDGNSEGWDNGYEDGYQKGLSETN